MRPNKLSDSQVQIFLKSLQNWQVRKNGLHRKFIFNDFKTAFAFMSLVAVEAEKQNHHPDWSNSFNTVDIELMTHDAGGITELDFKMASTLNKIYQNGI